jgi:NAD(P)-dependent dehydrogenase (short-subunit alcohol dehydrogenase family)
MDASATGGKWGGGAPPVVLLTGASRGIGLETARLFCERGWRVLTVSRKPPIDDGCRPVPNASHIIADLADIDGIDRLADEVRVRLGDGQLNALVNNAGISPKCADGSRIGVAESDAALWNRVLNVNLVSTALLVRALLPELAKAHGSIVNVTSIVASRVHPFAGAAYAASKAGLAALTREMAREFAPLGIRANAVAPGEINTTILSPRTSEIIAREVPMQRLGEPMEVAEVVYFLCAPGSSYVTGVEIPINGGQHV